MRQPHIQPAGNKSIDNSSPTHIVNQRTFAHCSILGRLPSRKRELTSKSLLAWLLARPELRMCKRRFFCVMICSVAVGGVVPTTLFPHTKALFLRKADEEDQKNANILNDRSDPHEQKSTITLQHPCLSPLLQDALSHPVDENRQDTHHLTPNSNVRVVSETSSVRSEVFDGVLHFIDQVLLRNATIRCLDWLAPGRGYRLSG